MSGNCIEGGEDVWRLYVCREGGCLETVWREGRCLETVWREGEMSGDCIKGGDVWRPYVGRWRCLETACTYVGIGEVWGLYGGRVRCLETVWKKGEMSGDCKK